MCVKCDEKKEGMIMREEKMRELMQQEPAVPQKVHDGFEKGLEQVALMDIGETGKGQKAGQKGRRGFWRRAALVAAAAAAVCAVGFHSQIYSFAESLFIHDVINAGAGNVQEIDAGIIKIRDGILSVNESRYFESLEELGEKLGISFLKSSAENDVKRRISVRMTDDGIVEVSDDSFVVKGISTIHYDDGTTSDHIDRDDAYQIWCKAYFYTKAFQDSYEMQYRDGAFIEDYETANGFHAKLFWYGDRSNLKALLYCDNIRYEYDVTSFGPKKYTVKEFEAFLDTLTK